MLNKMKTIFMSRTATLIAFAVAVMLVMFAGALGQ